MKPSSAVTSTRRFTHHLLSRTLLFLAAILPCDGPMAFEPGDSLTLGVFPRRPAATTQAMFTPLATQPGAILSIPVKAVLALIYHRGDAAGGGEVIPRLPPVQDKRAGKQLHELARSEPLAHLPWAISPTVLAANAALVADVLQQLNQTATGKAVLKTTALTGLRRTTDSDYAQHRTNVLQVLGEDYQ